MNNLFYNIRKARIILSSNFPGFSAFDALNGGLEEDASVMINYATDQVERKTDVTGENTQYSFKNNKSCDLEFSALHGFSLHKWVDQLWDLKESSSIPIELNGSFYDPTLNKSFVWSGSIKERPSTQLQGTLQAVKITLIGTAQPVPNLSQSVDPVRNTLLSGGTNINVVEQSLYS